MKRSFNLGEIMGLKIKARPATFISALFIWLLAGILGAKLLKLKPEKAIAGGFLAMLIHFFSDWWHQFGHAQAAEQTGYPMEGMEFIGPIARSQYPAQEGILSAEVHIQRALGGPIFSLLLAIVSALIALALRPFGNPALLLTLFSVADNLLVFTVGALLPLGFTDGSTLLQWMRQRQGNLRLNINGG
jgi:Zn-dependent protease